MKHSDEFVIESPDVKDGQLLDKKYAYKHDNEAPILTWRNAPKETKSFVLIVDDPDASTPYSWIHWVVYNIPADQTSIKEPLGRSPELPNGICQGLNSFGEIGYDGPSPAGIGHRYYFRVYALDIEHLPTPPGSSKDDVLLDMENHIIGKAHIMAKYEGP